MKIQQKTDVATTSRAHWDCKDIYYIYIYICIITSLHSTGRKPRSILGTPSTREEEKVTQ